VFWWRRNMKKSVQCGHRGKGVTVVNMLYNIGKLGTTWDHFKEYRRLILYILSSAACNSESGSERRGLKENKNLLLCERK
jgi:hypothetical protein